MKSIELNTTQNVVIEYEIASPGERWLAAFIDLVICYIASSIISALIVSAMDITNTDSGRMAGIVYGIMPLFLFMGYSAIMSYYAQGQTLGKRMMKIKVMRLDGATPSFMDYVLRSVFYLVDAFFSLSLLGLTLMNISPRRQRLGDLAANTIVVKLNARYNLGIKDILKISTTENHVISYPQVKNIHEVDMLLVKQAIRRYEKYKNKAHRKAIYALTRKMVDLLEIEEVPKRKIDFLKTVLKDYIVLTR